MKSKAQHASFLEIFKSTTIVAAIPTVILTIMTGNPNILLAAPLLGLLIALNVKQQPQQPNQVNNIPSNELNTELPTLSQNLPMPTGNIKSIQQQKRIELEDGTIIEHIEGIRITNETRRT